MPEQDISELMDAPWALMDESDFDDENEKQNGRNDEIYTC